MSLELRIQNLTKTYANGVRALRGVTLTIPAGMFGLLGPNGAGKSTLMRTIATLQDPDEGSIHFDGIDVIRDKQRLRRTLGYLPQEFGVYPNVSAERLLDHFAVLEGITSRRARKETVHALLHQTNLYDVRKKHVVTFSGGMRQRFGVAVALLGTPQLIIVDEPTAGLDPAERVRFLNLLAEVGESAVVILSTHIVEDVAELCPRMAIIQHGTILLDGQPASAIARMEGRIWRRTVERSELETLQREHAVISTRLLGRKTVAHVLADEKPGAVFEPVQPDLEDVYFSMITGASNGGEARTR